MGRENNKKYKDPTIVTDSMGRRSVLREQQILGVSEAYSVLGHDLCLMVAAMVGICHQGDKGIRAQRDYWGPRIAADIKRIVNEEMAKRGNDEKVPR